MKWCEVHQEQTETKCPECDDPCSKQWSASPVGSISRDAEPGQVANRLAEYWSTYNDQELVSEYTTNILLDDALYGIAIALSGKYKYAKGYETFKRDLAAWLSVNINT